MIAVFPFWWSRMATVGVRESERRSESQSKTERGTVLFLYLLPLPHHTQPRTLVAASMLALLAMSTLRQSTWPLSAAAISGVYSS